jgi:4-hydroxybenzoyl-CoA reductase alpha subunit
MKDKEFSVIGTDYVKVDAEAKVTGKAKFAGDITLSGTLWAKFLRSPHAHARIKSIDTSEAEALPGVKAIITGKDMTGGTLGCVEIDEATADKTPLCIDTARYVGDEIAAVAAVDEATAATACELIRVDYEVLPAIFDPEEAMQSDILIHDTRNQFDATGIEPLPNVNCHNIVEKGDVDKAFAEADHVSKTRYSTQRISHAALEPHSAIAAYESGHYTIWSSTQSAFLARFWIAHALSIPEKDIRVIKPLVGGGFGGKLDVFPHEACACLLAERTGSPVKFVLTREEVFIATRYRHPIILEVETAFRKDGTILAKKTKHILDGGAYGGTGKPANALSIIWANLPYKIPNIRMEAFRVYTNHPVSGAMRGYTSCQVHFACDSHMDEVAIELGIDPVDLRKMNAVTSGYMVPTGLKVTSCAFKETLDAASERIGWKKKHNELKRGEAIGFAGSGFISGTGYAVLTTPSNYSACSMCRLSRQGFATVYSGGNDIGQGLDTVVTALTAEVLGLKMSEVRICMADTDLSPFDTGTLGSRGTFLQGSSVKRAAEDARRKLFTTVSRRLEVDPNDLACKDHWVYSTKDPEKKITFEDAVWAYQEEHNGEEIVGEGTYAHVDFGQEFDGFTKGNYSPSYSFSTGAAQVKVDFETGLVDIADFIFAHDCGRPLNIRAVEGQVEGSVQMGLGFSLYEEVQIKNGKVINPGFRDYRFPTAVDMPQITSIFCGDADPVGPFGAKECGEGSTAPVGPTIANAIARATGIRFYNLPITPEVIWRAMKDKK